MPPETQNDPAAAETAHRRAAEQGDTTAAFNLGVLLHQKGDLDGAEAAYRRADKQGDARAAFNLGVLLQARGDLDGAEAAYRRAEQRGEAAGACNLGALLQRRDDVDGAEAAYRRAEEQGDTRAALFLAMLLQRRGDVDGAEAAYRRADGHGDARAAFYLGVLLQRRGDVGGAETAYRRAGQRGEPEVAKRAQAALVELQEQTKNHSDVRETRARPGSAVRRSWARLAALAAALAAAITVRVSRVTRFVRTHVGRFALVMLLLLVGSIIALVAVLASGGSSSSPSPAAQSYGATVAAVPTNRVTGSGSATVALRGDTATVTLRTTGLLNGSPHLAHIHGLGLGTCPTASAARIHNGHRAISTGDGIRWYGSALTSLTEWGSTSGGVPNNVDMNRYAASGAIRYTRTITVPRLVADLIRDGDATIVVHGIDYNGNHTYDFGALGVSDLDKALPGEATAPALCGPLRPAPGTRSASAGNPHGSATTTFVASLRPQPASVSDVGPGDLSLFCHIGQSAAIDSAANTTSRAI